MSLHSRCQSRNPGVLRQSPANPSRWQWDPDRVIGVASAATLVFAWVLL